jgi:UDP-3-O-[3-hydroxymyristoyl] glucosamine N-acyltransferase
LEILHFISRFFVEPENSDAVLGSSHIHSTAIIAEDVTIGPFSVLGAGVVIGNGCRIGANCHIENAVIGAYTKLSSGVVIGGSGFGFEEDPLTGTTLEFPHVGGVVIGDGVTIGSNTCIDRGSIGDTVIESYVKIDNLVHIAHNVKVRSGSKIVALSMIGGSVEIGKNSWISPGVAIRDWQNVGEGALVGLGAVVVKDVEQGDVVIGNPAKSMDVTRGRRK